MPTGTPNLERIKAAVSGAYPDARYGQYNCRRRNGWNWSQHAGSEPSKGYRGNAVDIVHRLHGYGDTTPEHQAWLDEVHAFLVTNRDALELNELIWRKRNHYDHIHTSAWPKMHDAGLYKPPCMGGDLIVIYEDGTRGDTFGSPAPPPPPPKLPEDDMTREDNQTTPEWVGNLSEATIQAMFDSGLQEGDASYGIDKLTEPTDALWDTFRDQTVARRPYF